MQHLEATQGEEIQLLRMEKAQLQDEHLDAITKMKELVQIQEELRRNHTEEVDRITEDYQARDKKVAHAVPTSCRVGCPRGQLTGSGRQGLVNILKKDTSDAQSYAMELEAQLQKAPHRFTASLPPSSQYYKCQ